jgi:phage-related minor tail protein
MRRGQAAIEYLIILAVVVIIALIVIGVIGGFPGMTRGISERDSASYWAAADVGITRYFVSGGTPTISLIVVRNNRLFAVNITSITLAGASVNSTVLPLAPGSSSSMYITAPTCTAGQSYSWTAVVNYQDSVYGNAYSFTGEKPLVGTCQT